MDFPREGEVVAERYRIRSTIGRGGMGIIFLAEDQKFGREIALKMILPTLLDNAQVVERFRRECALVQALQHKNIVDVFEYGQMENGLLYVTMEYLEGRDLSQELQDAGHLPMRRVEEITRQVLDALSAAHAKGIVHRDIKPSNIFLSRLASGEELIKVLDFGVARSVEEDTNLTATGNVCGSTAFMAPEMLMYGEVSLSADVYALGLVILEMLSGARAIPGGGVGEHVGLHLQGQFELPDALRGGGFDRFLRTACAQLKVERFEDAREMRAAFSEAFVGVDPSFEVSPEDAKKMVWRLPDRTTLEPERGLSPLERGLPEDAAIRHHPVTPSVLNEMVEMVEKVKPEGAERPPTKETKRALPPISESDLREKLAVETSADSDLKPTLRLPDVSPDAEPSANVPSAVFEEELPTYNPGAAFDAATGKVRSDPVVPGMKEVEEAPLELDHRHRRPEAGEEKEAKRSFLVPLITVLVVALFIVGAGVFFFAEPQWTSPEQVTSHLKAGDWIVGRTVVEDADGNEVWRTTALKSKVALRIAIEVCDQPCRLEVPGASRIVGDGLMIYVAPVAGVAGDGFAEAIEFLSRPPAP